MDKNEIVENLGKFIITPKGRQLLAGFQVAVMLEGDEQKVYPDSIMVICWSKDGGRHQHFAVDCRLSNADNEITRPAEDSGSKKPSRADSIINGLGAQNEACEFDNRQGFWVQGDCAFIDGVSRPGQAIEEYRKRLVQGQIACSHNHFCDAIINKKYRKDQ